MNKRIKQQGKNKFFSGAYEVFSEVIYYNTEEYNGEGEFEQYSEKYSKEADLAGQLMEDKEKWEGCYEEDK